MAAACFSRPAPGGRRVGQRRAGRRRDAVLLGHRPRLALLVGGTAPSSGEVRDLQPEAQGREALHEDLALVCRNGRDVDGPRLEDQSEALVGVGRLALLT